MKKNTLPAEAQSCLCFLPEGRPKHFSPRRQDRQGTPKHLLETSSHSLRYLKKNTPLAEAQRTQRKPRQLFVFLGVLGVLARNLLTPARKATITVPCLSLRLCESCLCFLPEGRPKYFSPRRQDRQGTPKHLLETSSHSLRYLKKNTPLAEAQRTQRKPKQLFVFLGVLGVLARNLLTPARKATITVPCLSLRSLRLCESCLCFLCPKENLCA